MAFLSQQYSPSDGLRNKTAFPAVPASEDAARKQIQDLFDQILQMYNDITAKLNSTADGDSGADNIGAAPFSDIEGTTVQQQLEDIRQQQVNIINDQLSFVDIASEGCVTNNYLGSESVTNDKILPGTIQSGSIGAKQVTTATIDDGAVGTNQMAQMSVTEQILSNNSVSAQKIQDASVITQKIADKGVTGAKLADGTITAGNIANTTITGAKLATGTITYDKLAALSAIPLASGDALAYDNTSDKLMLNVSGCTSVQLVPVVLGTGETPPSGTFPAGTLYIRYEA